MTRFSQVSLLSLSVLVSSIVGVGLAQSGKKAPRKPAPVALEGQCAVCYAKAGKWVPGSREHAASYDGMTYLFPSKAEKDAFRKAPERYAPVLNGDCIVCLAKAGVRQPGKLEHAVRHVGRIYLFPSEKEQAVFLEDPKSFEAADIAAGGLCVVCKAMDDKDVPGSAKFVARYKGLRYLFPAASQREMFLADPAKFVGAADRAARKPVSNNQDASTRVSVSGVTGCAACAFGIHPLGAPQELGLAVDAGDGRVFVVEDAHKLYPDVYEARFNGLRVALLGDAVKSDGLITWVKPESLTLAP